jgi:tetratricopeptide (TPR) repeat protein
MPGIVVLKDPLSPEEHINLGVAYEARGELDYAIREYRAASRKQDMPALLYLGNAYFQKNDLSEAERFYKEAIEKEPANADATNNLAWLYYTKKEKLGEAESLVIRAMGLNPSRRGIYQDTLDRIRETKGQEDLEPSK